jgi:hypothetical protein
LKRIAVVTMFAPVRGKLKLRSFAPVGEKTGRSCRRQTGHLIKLFNGREKRKTARVNKGNALHPIGSLARGPKRAK